MEENSINLEANLLASTSFTYSNNILQAEQIHIEEFIVDEDQDGIFSKICRTCLTSKQKMIDLYSNSNSIPEMIMSFSAVELDQNDYMPKQICEKCVEMINKVYAFKQQLENADATLRHINAGYENSLKLNNSLNVSYLEEERDNCDGVSEDYIGYDDKEATENEDYNEIIENELEIQEKQAETIAESVEENRLENKEKSQETSVIVKPVSSAPETSKTRKRRKIIASSKSSKRMLSKSARCRMILTNEETTVGKFNCTICAKKFNNVRKLNRHLKTHNDENKYNCKICSKKYTEAADLNRHMKKHPPPIRENNEEFPFNCDECHSGFNVEYDLKIHKSIHSKNGSHVCLHCSKNCETALKLRRHVRIHFVDKPHKCTVCDKGFPEMGSLTRHFRRHTGVQRERKHVCSICNKAYYDSHTLNIHIRSHTGERPWVCSNCGKSFTDSRLLNSHLKVHSDVRPYTCDICSKSFTHQSTLTTHFRTHTGDKPYVCSVCGKSFIQSSNLTLHMRVHNGQRPYQCTFCSRCFASSSTLTLHNRIHTGEKPYICPFQHCGKRFARSDISVHLRTHSGEKPFTCTQCRRKFTTSGQLNQHMKTHSNEKSFMCTICKKGCSTMSYLRKHLKIHEKKSATSDFPVITDKATDIDFIPIVTHTVTGTDAQNIEILNDDDLVNKVIFCTNTTEAEKCIPNENMETITEGNEIFAINTNELIIINSN